MTLWESMKALTDINWSNPKDNSEIYYSVVYKEKPKNPVDFFAKWLLHQSDIKKSEAKEEDKKRKIETMKEKLDYEASKTLAAEKEKELELQGLQDKRKAFDEKVE